MECFGSGKAIDTCRVEKMGCPGCAFYRNSIDEVIEVDLPLCILEEEEEYVHVQIAGDSKKHLEIVFPK